MKFQALILLGLCFAFNGCTILTVEQTAVRVPFKGNDKLAIGVVDSRAYVLSGEKSEMYEGTIHGAFGIPLSQNTTESVPLGIYLAARLTKGFEKAGFTVTKLTFRRGAESTEILAKIRSTHSGNAIVVNLRDWRYDMNGHNMSWQFFYEIDISVYSAEGNLLTKRSFKGRDTPPAEFTNAVPNMAAVHYQRKFDEFLADPVLQAAIHGVAEVLPNDDPAKRPDLYNELTKLDELRKKGLLTDAEFEVQKQKLLNQPQ